MCQRQPLAGAHGPRMRLNLISCHATVWLDFEHPSHQLDELVLGLVRRHPAHGLREGLLADRPRQLAEQELPVLAVHPGAHVARPQRSGAGAAWCRADLERALALEHPEEDAAAGPDVGGQELHVVCQALGRCEERCADVRLRGALAVGQSLREPEVDEGDVAVLAVALAQEVLRLDVAVQDAHGVQVLDRRHQLAVIPARHGVPHAAREALLEVPAAALKNEVERLVILEPLQHVHDVGMVQPLHQTHLGEHLELQTTRAARPAHVADAGVGFDVEV
mmetsp:Transcript_40490/g.120056  ORF Transcript_40490/g.120056 Transcript_40490/m.120056 type:complete len:278 (+) Transcript_40490:195-1028(+)